MNWTLTNIEFNYSDFKRDVSIKTNKPINFEKMLDYARKLSNKFCFCRVDFYEVDNVLYLGEMTFSPTNVEMNFNNRSISLYLGNFLNISKIKESK